MSEQIVCVGCGEPLGDPDDEFSEEGHYDFVEGRPKDDPRVRCSSTGQIYHPKSAGIPKSEYERGSGDERQESSQSETQTREPEQQPRDRGLDLGENADPLDLLQDVLVNPIYELSEPQINEVMSWAEEFEDGMIPPDSLEQILGLMEGVSQQKSQLMRQKYELKLQRWMRRRSEDSGGPPIGVMSRRGGPSPTSIDITGNRGRANGPQQRPGAGQVTPSQDVDVSDHEPDRVIDKRREKARDRADEFLDSFAENVGNDVGTFYTDIKNIVKTALMKKAERDPDWVLEKLEKFGGFELIQEIMEPSDAEQQRREQESRQPSVDREIDSAVESVSADGTQQNSQSRRTPSSQRETSSPERRKRQQAEQPSNEQQQQRESTSQKEEPREPYAQDEQIAEATEESPNSMEKLIEEQEQKSTEQNTETGEEEMFDETFGQLQEQ